MPKLEPLLGRDLHLLIARRLGLCAQPGVLIKPARVMQRVLQAERMVERSREVTGLVIERERVIGGPQMPARQREVATVRHAGILAGQRGPKRGALSVIVFGEREGATLR